MDLIEEAIRKYNHVPEKHHGSISFCPAAGKEPVLDFSSSCLDLKLDEVISTYIDSQQISNYPDPNSKTLKIALGKVLNISDENIMITNGASEAIFILGLAFCSKNKTVLIPEPTYSEYERVSKIFSSNIEKMMLPESGNYNISLKALAKSLNSSPDIVFLCNPNNPTGHYLDESILELFKRYQKVLFVLDEAYIDFIEQPRSLKKVASFQNVIILRSFTKAYGLAGLRLGYLVASTKTIKLLDSLKTPWNVNYLASGLGAYLLKNPCIIENHIKQYMEGKELLFNYFKQNYSVIPSQTNYFLLKVNDSKLFYRKLLENNVLVRECCSFGLNNYIRINAGRMCDCEKFISVFEKIKGEIDG